MKKYINKMGYIPYHHVTKNEQIKPLKQWMKINQKNTIKIHITQKMAKIHLIK